MNVISLYRNDIIRSVETNSVVIISHNPESYVSIYIPYYLVKSGFIDKPKNNTNALTICVIQNDLNSVRASTESCSTLLSPIYKVANITTAESNPVLSSDILYMTYNVLIKKFIYDPLLSDYSIIILTGVQNRQLYNDISISLLKRILSRRSRLRLILCMESLNYEPIFNYFKRKCNDIYGSIRPKPLNDVHYINLYDKNLLHEIYYISNPSVNYLDSIISTAINICNNEKVGNIMIFVPSSIQVELLYNSLLNITDKNHLFNIISLHNELNSKKIIPGINRTLFISTNVNDYKFNLGEISYIIDSCLTKRMIHNHINSGYCEHIVNSTREEISYRSKLVKYGKCYRLIREMDYNNDNIILDSVIPEIQTSDLTSVILLIKSLGISNLSEFEFITKPPPELLENSLTILYLLKALDCHGELIYPIGNLMAELPCTPYLSAFVYQSTQYGCSEEASIIYSMLQVKEYIWKDMNKKYTSYIEKLDAAKQSFAATEGDLVSYFNLFQLAVYYKDEDDKWLSRHMIKKKGINLAQNIREKIKRVLKKYQLEMVSCGNDTEILIKTIFSTFFYNVACKEYLIKNLFSSKQLYYGRQDQVIKHSDDDDSLIHDNQQPYVLLRRINHGERLFISPSSFVANEQPDWIVFNEIIEISGTSYVCDVTTIKPEYLQGIVPQYFGDCNVKPYLIN